MFGTFAVTGCLRLCWVFFYQTKEYVESGDVMKMLGGNAPIIVSNTDGSIYVTGTAHPIQKYIEEYRILMSKR